MTNLSNPFSTGGGGVNFEQKVQAVFLLALLIDGFSPILNRPIKQLIFQGKLFGHQVDDLIIISSGNNAPKICCQIKHDIAATEGDKTFQEVIAAAWADFQQKGFRPGIDKIVLATGIIAKNTIHAFRLLHECAINSCNAENFYIRIHTLHYISSKTKEKFSVLKKALASANGGTEPSEESIWKFCKSFVLLVFDLDFESSVNQMLIYSLIQFHSAKDARDVWARLSVFAGQCNQSGGCIQLDNIPDDLKELFNLQGSNDLEDSSNLPLGLIHLDPSELWVQLALIGSWNEKNSDDIKIVEYITRQPYGELQATLRKMSTTVHPYLFCQHGIWKIHNRMAILRASEKYFSDSTIEYVFSAASKIVIQPNNRFTENGDFSLLIPETGEYPHSDILRNNLINGLCNLRYGNVSLNVCSENIYERCAAQFIQNIFSGCDWIRLASLQDILPLIAEISPAQFISNLEAYVQISGAELINLLPKEAENPLFDRHFICGIIWSLETLAWSEEYLVPCVRCLGEMAEVLGRSQRGVIIKAIVDILLPWHPQTLASIQKQKNAVRTLSVGMPKTGWKVLKALLPGSTTFTGGTQKPKYIIKDIPEELKNADETIEALNRYYTSEAVRLAGHNIKKLEELADYIDYFDETAIETYLTRISENLNDWTDEDRFSLWNKLYDLQYRIRLSQADNKPPETKLYRMLCSTIASLTPQNRFVIYRRLYLANWDEYTLREDNDAWREKEQKKKEAILDIYNTKGLTAVLNFAEIVNNLYEIGYTLGKCIQTGNLPRIIQSMKNPQLSSTFLYAIIGGFVDSHDIIFLTTTGLQDCDAEQISDVLSHLPLSQELIDTANLLFSQQEQLFWQKVSIPAVVKPEDFNLAYVLDHLVEAKRPVAAVNMCGRIYGKVPLSPEKMSHLLKEAATTENTEQLDVRAVRKIIQHLQKQKEPNVSELSEIELLYFPYLNNSSPVHPQALPYRLANDSDFFCELVKLCYKKQHEEAEINDFKISLAWAERLFQVFYKFRTIPGTDWNGTFHEDHFLNWMGKVKEWARANDRYEVAMNIVGRGLSYASIDTDGLLCEDILRQTLDAADAGEIRHGYHQGIFNQRGAHFVDPKGREEKKLAQKYNIAAEKAEELGYSRYAELLRRISKLYLWEARQNAVGNYPDNETD